MIVFIFSTIIEVIEMIYSFKRTHKFLTIQNVFFVSIIINFILYLCNWSSDFVVGCQPITYTVIIVTQVLVTITDFYYLSKPANQLNFCEKIKTIKFNGLFLSPSTILFIVCLLCGMAENYLTYGMLFPFLNSIDSHKNVVPIFGTIWRSLYPIALIYLIAEGKYKEKKWYDFFFLIITALYLFISSGSRFWSVLSLCCAFFFWIKYKNPKIRFNKFILIILVIVILVIVMLNMGISRLTIYSYEYKIGYKGPFAGTSFGETVSWYYGYFPYSFHNLNMTLMNISNNNRYTYGLFFILPVLYLTKTYKIFGLQSYNYYAMSVRIVTNTAATVATAFFEFYADFGPFFFIPILALLIVMNTLEKRKTIFSIGVFSYLLIIWYMFNFYNVISNGIPYTFMLFLFICNKFFVITIPSNKEQHKNKTV